MEIHPITLRGSTFTFTLSLVYIASILFTHVNLTRGFYGRDNQLRGVENGKREKWREKLIAWSTLLFVVNVEESVIGGHRNVDLCL